MSDEKLGTLARDGDLGRHRESVTRLVRATSRYAAGMSAYADVLEKSADDAIARAHAIRAIVSALDGFSAKEALDLLECLCASLRTYE